MARRDRTPSLSIQSGSAIFVVMSKSSRTGYDRPLGAKAYAAMAKVEGLKLSKSSSERLERTKGMSPDKRRAEVLRAYGAKPKRK